MAPEHCEGEPLILFQTDQTSKSDLYYPSEQHLFLSFLHLLKLGVGYLFLQAVTIVRKG